MTDGKQLLTALVTLVLVAGLSGCMSASAQDIASPNRAEGITPLAGEEQDLETALVPTEASLLSDWDSALLQDDTALQFTVAEYTPARGSWLKEAVMRNADVVGWLSVPDTDIDTAIVQNPLYATNDYYLQHDFNGREDSAGTYCADLRNTFALPNRYGLSTNTVLYAHSFDDDPDSELFSQLKKYRDASFARTHPYIYFSTANEDMAWEVFAVFDTTVNMPYVWPELPEHIGPQVLDTVYASSLYDYGIRVTKDDKILTLSTCTYFVNGQHLPKHINNQYRFVVMARLVDATEVWKSEASLRVNSNPMGPDQQPAIDLSWIDDWV